jgi:hypothetical protein
MDAFTRSPMNVAKGRMSEAMLVGGLALSQLLTLYTTPVVYLYLDRLQLWLRGGRREPA